MSKLTSLIRRAPKRFTAVVAMIAAAIIVPAAVFAWGPDRPLFTTASPAPYVTFNSIKDNPEHGFEPNFMQIREANASNTTYADEISLQAGHEYVVYMYYHNNASSTLNDAAHNYAGIAHNAYAKTAIPYTVPKGTTKEAVGYIGASNANPQQVWDDIRLKNTSSNDLFVSYVPDSAIIHNFGATNGQKMSNSITTTGAPLGYDSLNGDLPGCNRYAGFVTYRIKVSEPNFTVSKDVRIVGQTEWKNDVTAKAGDTLEYKIQYKNTGSMKQDNVIVKDTLPAHMSYINGSTILTNKSNPNGKVVSDNLTNGVGINIGNYSPGSVATLTFKARIAAETELACGPNTLRNIVRVETSSGSKQDDANAIVNKECKPVVKYTCDALAITRLTKESFRFTTTTTAQNATFKKVTYIIRDAAGKEVDRKTSTSKTLEYTRTVVGKYTVEAVVTFTVNGQEKTATSKDCKKEFEVPSTPVYCPIPGKEHLPKDSPDCKETPVVPELPKTGPTENIVAIVGLGALIASLAYYIASRRALNQ